MYVKNENHQKQMLQGLNRFIQTRVDYGEIPYKAIALAEFMEKCILEKKGIKIT